MGRCAVAATEADRTEVWAPLEGLERTAREEALLWYGYSSGHVLRIDQLTDIVRSSS